MSYSIADLLTRNLHDVFGENDATRRRAAVDEIFHSDAVFYEPGGAIYRGKNEIESVAGKIRAGHPNFQYQVLGAPEGIGDGGRIRWVSGIPGQKPKYAGTDFLIARNGKIAAIYLFFDALHIPVAGSR